MKGIFVKPERLEEALNNEGFYLNIFDLPVGIGIGMFLTE